MTRKFSVLKITFYMFLLAVCGIIILFVQDITKRKGTPFSVKVVSSKRPFNPLFETKPLNEAEKEEMRSALEQNYHYYGCGGQAYVFFSADQKYVLKLLKQRAFKVPLWIQYFPIPWILDGYRERKIAQRQNKLYRDFMSYKIAFDDFHEDSGLVCVHLNKTEHLTKTLTVYDKHHKAHKIDLDKTDFILQKKADLVFDRISTLVKAGNIKGAESAIEAVIDLVALRCRKGYYDRDNTVHNNYGFLGNKAISIDIGRLIPHENLKTAEGQEMELLRFIHFFASELKSKHPELMPYVEQKMTDTFEALSSNTALQDKELGKAL